MDSIEFNPEQFDYKRFIENNFDIIDKKGNRVPFKFNNIQNQYFNNDYTGYDDILKARQQGFSSLITAIFGTDFILRKNSYSVVVADVEDNSEGLLSKVKLYIQSYEDKNKIKVPLKYNSKNELYNNFMNTYYKIGTAKNTEFGRSRTITNLHLSEVAYFSSIKNIIAGAGQAVVEGGRFIKETTANGFNEYKEERESVSNFNKLFYPASKFYHKDFLEKKKLELKDKYCQEYPETEIEAFISSGETYFDKQALRYYLEHYKTSPLVANCIWQSSIY